MTPERTPTLCRACGKPFSPTNPVAIGNVNICKACAGQPKTGGELTTDERWPRDVFPKGSLVYDRRKK